VIIPVEFFILKTYVGEECFRVAVEIAAAGQHVPERVETLWPFNEMRFRGVVKVSNNSGKILSA
jgi:hypothetical protein